MANEKVSKLENLKDEDLDHLKKKLDQLKGKIENVKKALIKKFDKYVVGIALLPPKKEEKDKVSLLVLMEDDDSKKMSKLELKDRLTGMSNKLAKEIDKNIVVEVMLTGEMRQNCFDNRYEFLELMGMSMPFYDPKDFIKGLKVSAIHKEMVLKKFEKYILSYVAAGSLFRGDKKSHDIDVWLVVDDTDVKRMPRFELKEKLRTIITSQGFEANAIAQTNKKFHVQVYILTDFWEGIKDANPVFFTLLRDGIPLFDKGVFMPWKLLLEMGRIKPSPEAIDMFMDSGEKILEKVKFRLKEILEMDIYWAVVTPSQAALMLYGLPPPTPKETVKLMEEIFVKKEKLLEKKYVTMLEEIRSTYKGVEHEKIKEINGSDIDRLLGNANDYLKRIKTLFDEIQERKDKESVVELYESCSGIIKDVMKLNEIKGESPERGMKKLVEMKELPVKFGSIFKEIKKAKKDYDKGKLARQEIIKVNKDARLFIRSLVEYGQRKRGRELQRATIRVKYGNKFGEVLLLDDSAFIIKDVEKKREIKRAAIHKDGSFGEIKKSDLKSMEKDMEKVKVPKRVLVKEKTFEELKGVFGDKVEVLLG